MMAVSADRLLSGSVKPTTSCGAAGTEAAVLPIRRTAATDKIKGAYWTCKRFHLRSSLSVVVFLEQHITLDFVTLLCFAREIVFPFYLCNFAITSLINLTNTPGF